MNILSLFDGISCGRVALERANIKVNKYYASEIDKYAIQVSQNNYPDIIRLGDINNWESWDIDFSSIDLILAGSPCQGFSFAGKQLAFDDKRSALFFRFAEILEHVKSLNQNVKFLLENVRMKKEFERIITSVVGVEPIMINSALVSAQNRKRLYWCNWNVDQPKDKNIFWNDVRERGVNESKYYYTEKAMQWLAKHSRKNNKTLNIHDKSEKMQMIEASHCKKYSSQRFFGIIDFPADRQAVAAMHGRYIINNEIENHSIEKKEITAQFIEFRFDNKTNSLTTINKDWNVHTF
ncbi:DNA cytosine methyltransferase [Orbus wheelerorum]|uniref:DNA cytosine methyltransferase n=1 Tax=Orbus wheelerorum TaxID=3074111 RepID=UPI00370D99E2